MSHQAIWANPQEAAELTRQSARIKEQLTFLSQTHATYNDALTLLAMGEEESDTVIVEEACEELRHLSDVLEQKKLELTLSNPTDPNDAYVEIHPGAGGTESQDWAQMLLRMYTRWCARKKFKVETVDYAPGEEAGLKSVTLLVKGLYAYGWLKLEAGVHRLVRISPFDSNKRRHTSFASVWVYPVLDDSIKVEVNKADIRIDTYRSSGAGGQHVNTTDSAVRITDLKRNIVVQCQQERSQHENLRRAWNMLHSRIYELEEAKRKEEAKNLAGEKKDIGWGHQVRSYVLEPYQLVKDLRCEVESNDPNRILDGDLDMFMRGNLFYERNQQKS